jgi:hypothetical protein
MLVREKYGRYAGEIRDFPEPVAHQLIAQGRGENPFADPDPIPPVIQQPIIEQPRRGKRK